MSGITVVTAFYEIPSKFTQLQYWSWITNFMINIPCNLVIFTSGNLVGKFQSLRCLYKDKTFIISKEFSELHHYQFKDSYDKYLLVDYQPKHSPELYIIWAEKVKFVTEAIKVNPFNSDIFIWCDIGIFRESQFFNRFRNFPQRENINLERMNFLLLEDFTDKDRTSDSSGIKGQNYFENAVRIGGGIQAGSIECWLKYSSKWDEMLQRYFKVNRFAGQDQCIIGSIYLEDPDMFHLIRALPYGGDIWFYLLYYWS